jgi:hypothetical protein
MSGAMRGEQMTTRLAVTQAMADELNDYLMGNDLYRQTLVETPAGSEQVVMTPGALLENLALLGNSEPALSDAQRAQLAAIRDAVARARRTLPDQWQALLHRELKALLDSRKWYLDDLEQRRAEPDQRGPEAQQRARIDLILRELGGAAGLEEERRRLAELDARERGNL